MEKKDKKSEIIAVATELIALNGFNATGIDAVLKAAGIPKGSFYHYFQNKEDFGLAVIDQFAADYQEKLRFFFTDHDKSPLERMRNYFERSLDCLGKSQFAKGCLIGNLGQELAGQNEHFRERIETVFQSWLKFFSDCIIEAQEEDEIDSDLNSSALADFILGAWEGAMLHAKVMKSAAPILNFIDSLFSTVLRKR